MNGNGRVLQTIKMGTVEAGWGGVIKLSHIA